MTGTAVVAAREEGTGAEPVSTALGVHYEGLDGLRGVAVLLVLAYHAQVSWVRGGYLGVSLFFTLSGFLITSILIRNHLRRRAGLRPFWMRRIRRLMPAAFLALAGIVLFGATVVTHQQAERLPGDVLAAATWTTNWRFILNGTSYADLFSSPSPVQHFWSLAIEEQLYLLLPVGLLLLSRRRYSARRTALALGGVALAGTAWMAFLQTRGVGFDRLYYGTDTRMAELLAGAVLAVVVSRVGTGFSDFARRALVTIGVVGFAVIVGAGLVESRTDPNLYRGGFLVFALASCAAILGVLAGNGPLRAALSVPPLPFVGRISYGLYLYHFPIYLWLDGPRTGLSGWQLLALRLAVTFAIAIASYRFVEQPILHGASFRIPRRHLPAVAALTAVAVVVGAFALVDRDAPDPLAALRAPRAGASLAGGSDSAGSPRVLVVGDSQAVALANGLDAWAADGHRARVYDLAAEGCGLVVQGRLRNLGVFSTDLRHCRAVARRRQRALHRIRPDVVVVLSSITDVEDRQVPGATDFATVGDPAVDAFLARQYRDTVDALSSTGAEVVWMRPPCVDPAGLAVALKHFDTTRITRLDRTVVPALARARAGRVRLFDLDRVLCPGGRPLRTVAGVGAVRPDGVHFSPAAARWFADHYAPAILGTTDGAAQAPR